MELQAPFTVSGGKNDRPLDFIWHLANRNLTIPGHCLFIVTLGSLKGTHFMFRHLLSSRGLAAAILIACQMGGTAAFAGNDKAFFQTVSGTWKGPGEIVAGKYKGTKFNCTISGTANQTGSAGITLDGTCHVGVFSQPMNAMISNDGGTYRGKFLDGATGKGLDITGGNVSEDKIVVSILRKSLNGAMIARLENDKTMNVTISVKVEDKMVPVIGMKLNRSVDAVETGAIK
jgi:hypothetical protein